ncbi:vitamin K epoxide reductase family protein [Actinotalea caeni]|uniref:vitamin K epoxide reductase family protein n=1 Tax=Actinotalea caeni TaxID=1348467 RepID=UPI0012E28E49|nr:vitamin K epoxide reductase family protein [Actinotalea caeni]
MSTTADETRLEPDDAAGDLEPLEDRWAGTEHQRAGGASRGYGLLLVVTGVLGAFAAAMLTIEYIHKLKDPDATLICDINPFLTCGAFLGSPQASAFGFPNVVIGMLAFPVVVATGALLLGGVRLPRWYWRGLLGGTLFGIGFVTWLQYQALFSIRAICPWCALVWAVMIPLFVHTVARSTQNGALPAGSGLRALLVQYRWVLTALWWLLVVAVALIALADRWSSLL